MFGGGEEYFQDPPEIDRDTLRHFATFAARLRAVEKPGKKSIAELAALAREVGDTNQAYELVVGTIFRHIKTWTGNKQLACWYVLDKLCKEDRDKYGYTASKYILEIGPDYIPYEDPAVAPKYESLVEHWEGVFPRHVVDALWMAKKERLWAVDHPAEVLQQQQEEEREWVREEDAAEDEDGLNDFGQPCIDYLQGRCTWGDSCRLLHPPGEEGSLPPECRMGDWKCQSCGVINRHYRRRCSNCVREKPQYKKTRTVTAEDAMLSAPDDSAQRALRQQFGYDPYAESEAVAHWKLRLGSTTVEDYLAERRAAYRVRILGRPPANALEERCKLQKHYPDVDLGPDTDLHLLLTGHNEEDGGPSAKRARQEGVVPSNTSPSNAVALVAQTILERGVRDGSASQLFAELARHARLLANGEGHVLSEPQAEAFLSVCKLGFTAWNTNEEAAPFVAPFFKALSKLEGSLGLSSQQQEQLTAMTTVFTPT